MNELDHLIEAHESAIAELSEDVDYHRNRITGDWLEWRDYTSSQRARHINAQAVLFAIKEGL